MTVITLVFTWDTIMIICSKDYVVIFLPINMFLIENMPIIYITFHTNGEIKGFSRAEFVAQG